MEKISVVILAKDNEKTIAKALASVASFDEVLLCDTGSTDATVEIAKRFSNVRIIRRSLTNFGALRNEVAKEAKNDWILSLDSDEELSKEFSQPEFESSFVYSFPFKNFFQGKWIKGCGWYPDRHVRLYNRQKTAFSNVHLHEKIQTSGLPVRKLSYPIHHYSYQNTTDFLTKMQRYSELFAKQNAGKKSSLFKALKHGAWAFFKSYIIKRGFLDGKQGYIISAYNGQTAYYKYLKLAEHQCS
ncbi:MAG: glycosyltransferase family 2 protein [Candidatus Algichlamydia australiensis]|nr:glycosyltransferase family 2 protein [Chlamydiales bacterium]